MLTIPVFDITDEDLGYYGWTDNISFIKNTLLGNKSVATAINSQPKKNSVKDIPIDTLKNNNISHRSNHSKLLDANHTFFEKYDIPMTYQLRFNSLRSGPFGNTDPLLSKLFSADSSDIVNGAVGTDNEEIYVDNFSDYLKELFARENKTAVENWVDIPGELQEPFRSMVAAKNNHAGSNTVDDSQVQNNEFWDMPYQDINFHNVNDMPIHVATNHVHVEYKSTKTPRVIRQTPVYEFPSKYRELEHDSQLQKSTLIPPSHLTRSFDYLHI